MAVPQRSTPSLGELRNFYVGKDIKNVPQPAVILDKAKMRRHCDSLLEATEALGVGFRAHIKTHKTIEGTRLQASEMNAGVKLVVSTIAEIDHISPLLQEFKSQGRPFNVLYGIPLPKSQVSRLAEIGKKLGSNSVSVLIDHASQLHHVLQFFQVAGFPADVYVKVDTGYHRAGLPPSGINKGDLISQLMQLHQSGHAKFAGLYSHSSLSYNDSTPKDAMANLEGEIDGCLDALHRNAHLFSKEDTITISVGASPQVTSIENLVAADGAPSAATQSLRATIQKVTMERPCGFHTQLELHAGVYSILDIQQLATNSRANFGDYDQEIAISVVAEVCSVYNDGERPQPEALVAVGVLGLGREPCAAYKGWGIVSVACSDGKKPSRRLIISRVSQEHSIVSWEHSPEDKDGGKLPSIPLEIGQSICVYPNHACITGALYGWYLVVDSDDESNGNHVVDVWVRASGW